MGVSHEDYHRKIAARLPRAAAPPVSRMSAEPQVRTFVSCGLRFKFFCKSAQFLFPLSARGG
jgi:hypothetical protein